MSRARLALIVIEMNKKSIFSFHINYEAGGREAQAFPWSCILISYKKREYLGRRFQDDPSCGAEGLKSHAINMPRAGRLLPVREVGCQWAHHTSHVTMSRSVTPLPSLTNRSLSPVFTTIIMVTPTRASLSVVTSPDAHIHSALTPDLALLRLRAEGRMIEPVHDFENSFHHHVE